MKNRFKIFALILSVILVLGMLPVTAYAADDDMDGYNDHDYGKIRTFLEQLSDDGITTNGARLNAAYDSGDPATWTGFTWNSDSEKRVVSIGIAGTYPFNNRPAGTLDVSGLTALTVMDCYGNALTGLDISGCTDLQELHCGSNSLTALNVSGLTSLTTLRCFGNELIGLDISGCTALQELHCGSNRLAALDLTGLTSLTLLNCDSNSLTALDVSGLANLQELQCGLNQLTVLDVSGLAGLQVLNCGDNYSLTVLDVSGCTALEELSCGYNQLPALDVSGCTALERLSCSGNLIGQLDLRTNTALELLFCDENPLTLIQANMFSNEITLTAQGNGYVTTMPVMEVNGGHWATATPHSDANFTNWTKDGAEVGTNPVYLFSADTEPFNLVANFADNNDGDQTSSSGRGSEPKARLLDSGEKLVKSIPLRLNRGAGIASVEINPTSLTSAFERSTANGKGVKTVIVDIPETGGTKADETILPASFFAAGNGAEAVKIKTDTATVIIRGDMLAEADTAGARHVSLTIAQGRKSDIENEEVKNRVGDRPVIRLTLSMDSEQYDWSNPNAPAAVSIPYEPAPEELDNPESIVVWYIDGSGNAVCVPNGRYDPETGAVTFRATHFSDYAAGYNPVSFGDVPSGAWYNKAVSFIAAREITMGTGDGNFSPDAKLTRGQFLVMLMKAYEIAPDTVGSDGASSGAGSFPVNTAAPDNFFDAGNTYYTGYLAAAKRLGISGGVGNNMFAPERQITRQEMFTMLYNVLKVIGQLPQTTTPASADGSGMKLSDFSDADQVASWAEEAMALLVKTGTVSGSDGKLSPRSVATRAEMAQVLYGLLSR